MTPYHPSNPPNHGYNLSAMARGHRAHPSLLQADLATHLWQQGAWHRICGQRVDDFLQHLAAAALLLEMEVGWIDLQGTFTGNLKVPQFRPTPAQQERFRWLRLADNYHVGSVIERLGPICDVLLVSSLEQPLGPSQRASSPLLGWLLGPSPRPKDLPICSALNKTLLFYGYPLIAHHPLPAPYYGTVTDTQVHVTSEVPFRLIGSLRSHPRLRARWGRWRLHLQPHPSP